MWRSSRSKHLADAKVFECKPSEAIAGGYSDDTEEFRLNPWGSHGATSNAGEMGVGEIGLYEAVFE
jgi:hypothetical protein